MRTDGEQLLWHAIVGITFKIHDHGTQKKQLILTQPVRKGIKAIKVRLDQRTVINFRPQEMAFGRSVIQMLR